MLLTLAACVSCACGKERTLPPVTPGEFARYAEDLSMNSIVLGRNVSFNILLPDDYLSSPERRYPVVYMFHGYGDNRKSWNDQWLRVENKVKELEADGLEPMIYVFPDGYNSYYCNTYDGSFRYMDMFIEEFVPYIDRTYRTLADRDHRAAIGYSMGGFGAMVLPLKHTETFSVSVPLSMSFRTDEQYMTEGPQGGWDNQWGRIFGGMGLSGEARLTDYYKKHCPYWQFLPENKEELSKVRWFFHCGDDEEQLLIANDDLHVQLRKNGYDHEYRVSDGGHTSGYWRNALDEVLPYISFVIGGGNCWTAGSGRPEVRPVEFDKAGVFISKGAVSADSDEINVIYLAHHGFEKRMVEDLVAVLVDGVPESRKYVIFPCNLEEMGIAEWVGKYQADYGAGADVGRRYAVAFGEAGRDVFGHGGLFSRLHFDNASLVAAGAEIEAESDKFYFIGQTDDGPFYEDMGGLYKACKASGASFEYRIRNGSEDAVSDILSGAKAMRIHINY